MATLGIITALGDRFPVLFRIYDLWAIEMYYQTRFLISIDIIHFNLPSNHSSKIEKKLKTWMEYSTP